MNFYFGMGGTPISLRQKLRMQRERMQCAGLWPAVLNVLNSYLAVVSVSDSVSEEASELFSEDVSAEEAEVSET